MKKTKAKTASEIIEECAKVCDAAMVVLDGDPDNEFDGLDAYSIISILAMRIRILKKK